MNALPTLKEEIDRKAFETVEWLIGGFNAGRMTAEQLSTGLDSLFMAVNGLVDEGVADLITAGSTFVGLLEAPTLRHCFVRKNMIVSLTWIVGEDSFEVVNYQDGVATRRITKKFDTAKEASVALHKATDTFVGAGFTKL